MNSEVKKASLKEIAEALSKVETDTLLVVVDSRVWQLYGKDLEENINKVLEANKKVLLYKTLEGEATKSMAEFEKGLEFFLEKGIHRKSHLVAIGGGATSDFAGFLAATLLRGLSWSVIPTTLLSMVDAGIGGKTGLNSKNGKNLIGAFHMPDHVWINECFLETLPETELNSGKGEVIKYGFLSQEIAELLKAKSDLSSIIEACAQKKEAIVQADFTERGERISLNLGHTFGHAIEKIYTMPHGEAIFWGMALIFKLYGTEEQLKLLRTFETGVGASFGQSPWFNKTFPVDKIIEYVSKDKKVKSNGIVQTVTIKEVGKFETKERTLDEIRKELEKEKDELRIFDF
ncbi:MAG: 3-dehydroquinate synthase family protein [Bdellovibrionota bacterium]|nr:3-dehydroquinate synthase family protein [Bdellovibrionota bacterium]